MQPSQRWKDAPVTQRDSVQSLGRWRMVEGASLDAACRRQGAPTNDVIHGATRGIKSCKLYQVQLLLKVHVPARTRALLTEHSPCLFRCSHVSGTTISLVLPVASLSVSLLRRLLCIFSTVVIPRQGATLISQDTRKEFEKN
jgi:hypothetical protein